MESTNNESIVIPAADLTEEEKQAIDDILKNLEDKKEDTMKKKSEETFADKAEDWIYNNPKAVLSGVAVATIGATYVGWKINAKIIAKEIIKQL